jgi:hypothetical protein
VIAGPNVEEVGVAARPDSGRWHGGVTGKAEGGEVGGGQRKEEGVGWRRRSEVVDKDASHCEEDRIQL